MAFRLVNFSRTHAPIVTLINTAPMAIIPMIMAHSTVSVPFSSLRNLFTNANILFSFSTKFLLPTFPILNAWLHNQAFQRHDKIKTFLELQAIESSLRFNANRQLLHICPINRIPCARQYCPASLQKATTLTSSVRAWATLQNTLPNTSVTSSGNYLIINITIYV